VATAAVTRCGYRRGEFFEGCEARRGERAFASRSASAGTGRGRWRNAANPRTGSGMQQARDLVRGENRRGGEKPRGRNAATSGRCRQGLFGGPSPSGSIRGETCRWRGVQRNPRRGGPRGPGRDEHPEGAGSPRGRCPSNLPRFDERASHGKTSKAAPVTVQRQGGGGEGLRSATEARWGNTVCVRDRRAPPRRLEGHRNSTRVADFDRRLTRNARL
jgi:hypothetical protein